MNRARLITVRPGSKQNTRLKSVEVAFKTVVTKSSSDPYKGGQLWLRRQGMAGKGKGDVKKGKKEDQHQNENPNPSKDVALLSLEHRMMVESRESVRSW